MDSGEGQSHSSAESAMEISKLMVTKIILVKFGESQKQDMNVQKRPLVGVIGMGGKLKRMMGYSKQKTLFIFNAINYYYVFYNVLRGCMKHSFMSENNFVTLVPSFQFL